MKKAIFIVPLVVALDQATKLIIKRFMAPYETIEVFPFLQIVSIRNKGAAFGLFSNLGNLPFIVISSLAIIFLSVYLFKSSGIKAVALCFILGGAIGNLIDRLYLGKVVDFIDFHIGRWHWPAFNVADSCLVIGMLLFAIGFGFTKNECAIDTGA